MVAQVDMGNSTRSLVRVPGSGAGKQDVSTVLMDFTHVSTLAAMVPVPSDLPAVLATGNSERNLPEFKVKGTDSPAISLQNLQPSAPSAGSSGSPSSASPPVGKIQPRLYVVKTGHPMAAQRPYARPVTQAVRINTSARTVLVMLPPRNNNGPVQLRAESVTRIFVVTGSIRNQFDVQRLNGKWQ
ncbi:uncharacterized protein LOC125045018 isoform X2 [Penaeus chinensis]|uniref:uncharacterized protein LOC125045018 isoform X2 n=1 Tax=Penaeus chinensis TaxID=139456 RepID=UPI001FB6A4E7|nr:uncharacterized protein LOC125045018 isoform X2 [Penaeus chinensis]